MKGSWLIWLRAEASFIWPLIPTVKLRQLPFQGWTLSFRFQAVLHFQSVLIAHVMIKNKNLNSARNYITVTLIASWVQALIKQENVADQLYILGELRNTCALYLAWHVFANLRRYRGKNRVCLLLHKIVRSMLLVDHEKALLPLIQMHSTFRRMLTTLWQMPNIFCSIVYIISSRTIFLMFRLKHGRNWSVVFQRVTILLKFWIPVASMRWTSWGLEHTKSVLQDQMFLTLMKTAVL